MQMKHSGLSETMNDSLEKSKIIPKKQAVVSIKKRPLLYAMKANYQLSTVNYQL
jgi:hypothetical protein